MFKEVKKKECRNPNCDVLFKPFKTTDKFCSWDCAKTEIKPRKTIKTKRIPSKSKKQKIIDSKYTVQRIQFLSKPENQICFIDACRNQANTVEHTKGRGKGFFDQYAEENNIPKTLDERFWKPCCLKHNLELENNPELSKKYQLSKLHPGKKI